MCEIGIETKIVLSEENLANFIKQSTQQKREKRNEKRVSKSKQPPKKKKKKNTQSISLKGKGTNYVPKLALEAYKKKNDEKLEKTISFEKPSPLMMVCLYLWCFKIQVP